MNPRMAIWHDVPTLNAYIARCQGVLQSGPPDNDVLLYWPLDDYWHGQGMLFEMVVHNLVEPRETPVDPTGRQPSYSQQRGPQQWLLGQPVGTTARHLWNHGYGFDYVSDRLLAKVSVRSGELEAGGARYRVVVVPPTGHIPLPTLEKLLALADSGTR